MENNNLEKAICGSFEEAKKVEMVYHAIQTAKDMIALTYKPDNEAYANPLKQITDEKIKEYYYELNSMCCDLIDRGVMRWQKEEQ